MKKRIISAMLLAAIMTTSAFANETKEIDLTTDYKNTKEVIEFLKKTFPTVHDIVTDYFQAKTCKENFINSVSIDEIRKFASTYQYGILIGLKYQDTPTTRAKYLALISAYEIMNCGSGDAMDGFVVAISGIAVEMNNK